MAYSKHHSFALAMDKASDDEVLLRFLESEGVCTDTRKLVKGQLFFALRGSNFDGNTFAQKALDSGAKMVVVDDQSLAHTLSPETCLFVDNCLQALQNLACLYRKKALQNTPIFAIGGSNGKTTTKEITAAILSEQYEVYRSEGNQNNHIGVPLSILSIRKTHDIAVIEMGANHIGEHKLLCDMVQPTHLLLTNCGKDHLEGYGGELGVIKATKELVDYAEANKIPVFWYANDKHLPQLFVASRTRSILFGERVGAQKTTDYIYGWTFNFYPFLTVVVDACIGSVAWKKIRLDTKLFGSFQLPNVLAATAVGIWFNISQKHIQKAIACYTPSDNRTQYISWKGNTVLLDAYNANPSSMQAVLGSFSNSPASNKVAILGAMTELGAYEKEEHKSIVDAVVQMNIDKAIFIGSGYKGLVPKSKLCHYFPNTAQAKHWIQKEPLGNHFILVKGSRAMKLESLFTD